MAVVTRASKGSVLTHSEMDANFEEINLKANLTSPAFTGTPTAPTAVTGTNTTQVATTEFVLANSTVSESDIKTALNASGSAPIYACRAWVNFNGTGTVAIRASGNVSSITDNGTGSYTVNFTTAMADVNYGVIATGSFDTAGGTPTNYTALTVKQGDGYNTTNSCRVNTAYYYTDGGSLRDFDIVCLSIFR